VAERLGQEDRAQKLRKQIGHAEGRILVAAVVVGLAWCAVLLVGASALGYWVLRWLFTPTPEIPPRSVPLVRPWHVLDALELAAVMIAIVVVSKITAAMATFVLPAAEAYRVAADVAAYLGAAAIGLAWIKTRLRAQPMGVAYLLGLARPAGRGLVAGFVAYSAFAAAIAGVSLAFVYLAGGLTALARESGTVPAEALRNPLSAAVYAALAVVVAPIVEETIFRGFIYAGLRRRLSVGPAALASAAVFALAHVGVPLAAKLGIAALAVALAYAYERTRNLWVSIGMHMTHNALVFAVLILAAL